MQPKLSNLTAQQETDKESRNVLAGLTPAGSFYISFFHPFLQIWSQGCRQVLDRQRACMHPRHGRQRERTDSVTQGRGLQEKVVRAF